MEPLNKRTIDIEEEIKQRQEKYKKPTDYFIRIPKKLWSNHLGGCSPTERCVFITIMLHINYKTNNCFPSIRTIAKILSISPVTTQSAIFSLIEKGKLKKVRRGRNNLYSLT